MRSDSIDPEGAKSKRPHRRTRGVKRKRALEAQAANATDPLVGDLAGKTFNTPASGKQVGGYLVEDTAAAEISIRPSGDDYWRSVSKPKRMSDLAVEARAIREGWIQDCERAQHKAVVAIETVIDEPTSSTKEKMQAASLIFRVGAMALDSIKVESMLSLKSHELNESIGPVAPTTVKVDKDELLITSAAKLLEGARTRDELKMLRDVMERQGLLRKRD